MNNEKVKEELIKAYKNLSLDAKRNEFNKELISLAFIVNAYLKDFDPDNYGLPKNYIQGEESNLNEDDLLETNYSDLLDIKDRLMLLMKFLKR